MWIPSWLRKRTVPPKRRPVSRFRPRLEVLEDRAVPATFLVNTNLDILGHANGMLSLRQAIIDANATPKADTIVVRNVSRRGESVQSETPMPRPRQTPLSCPRAITR